MNVKTILSRILPIFVLWQVALQFPDELLHISTPVFRSLRRRIPIDTGLYILADTSYGR